MIVANPSLLPCFPASASQIASPPFPSSAVPSCRPPSVPRGYDPPNSRQFILLQPLCSLFSTSVLCFQSLAASFAKKRGVGYTPKREAYSGNSLTQIEGRLEKV